MTDLSEGESKETDGDPENIETHLLPEEPADESDFPNHRRVVDALEKTVTSDDPGQSIALLGALGSGKSTIIQMLKKRLEKSNGDCLEARVITYDAWTHRGESIRRSFIQELAGELRGSSWEPTSLEQGVEQVTHRRTRSSTQVTALGIVLAIAGILLPPALILISSFGADSQIPNSIPLFGGYEVAQVASSVSVPILGGILVTLVLLVVHLAFSRESGTNIFSSEVSTQRSEREPSTVDFRRSFERIGREVLKNSDRRLVLVIENMDRLSKEQAQREWATLQTFFDLHRARGASRRIQDTSNEVSGWRDRFWTVVPFSKAPIDLGGGLVDTGDFIQKTFQMTLRVNSPIASDREAFFEKQFGRAFPGFEGTEVMNKVKQLYNAQRPVRSGDDPRSIKRFLNNLVGSVRQWGTDPISIPVQAIYQIEIEDPRDFKNDIKREDRLSLTTESVICGLPRREIREKLVMLHFGAGRDRALQYLLKGEVSEPLKEGEGKELRKLKKEIDIGFDIALREAVLSIVQSSSYDQISAAASALEALDSESVETSKNRLASALREVDQWKYYNSEVGEGIARLLRNLDDDEFRRTAPSVLNSISNFT